MFNLVPLQKKCNNRSYTADCYFGGVEHLKIDLNPFIAMAVPGTKSLTFSGAHIRQIPGSTQRSV